MIENQRPQEKLLTMLTEIYDQLEELEAVLEHSLTDLRGNLSKQQSSKITLIEHDLSILDSTYKQTIDINKQPLKQTLKLGLGF
jgi:hypothetical protein